ncbi:alcohol dehydrogenase catalytic domain-containing protein [Conexibacter sp. JD483]|uniref:zinc-dependent alcohol dehydrogenase n=1 Tax=unclassified Conexibacter TaxID=2627773 RepID=UPI00271B5F60|nr:MULTISPECIES: alcohol dehydrogenase catalytic domain-containing protein [unclassified Conexibacter]MDO8187938.1 alcohol dehydrogenase catalytic domain-containing protein [Conexibacter sp. CPCC 205706]MDO8200193.1 alcohol dehydrogenase catalytic domain-containing protein [Conexibacter sp. CPCC 205762]MDR9369739.1 alcohol dehydrogenase catalytic domain-containing protein [Conexibacter sp. JD483]
MTVTAGGGLELIDAPEPPLADGEVRVTVGCCGICGSDLHMLASPTPPVGLVLGHEFTGTVTELGHGAEEFAAGDRVAIRPLAACGECYACGVGQPHLCERGLSRGPGLGRPGAYAQTVAVPTAMLHRLPPGVSDEHGALAEPLAVAIHGIALAEPDARSGVWVIGAGPIGALTAVSLRARGIERVVVVEPNDERRAKAAALGAAVATPEQAEAEGAELFGGEPARIAIDCSGHPSGTPLAVRLLPAAGRLVVVGIPDGPVAVDVLALALGELTIKGSLAYSTTDFTEALEHIAAGRIPCDEIITAVAGLEEAPRRVAELRSGGTQQLKVLLRP